MNKLTSLMKISKISSTSLRRSITAGAFVILFALLFSKPAFAGSSNCQAIYGGGQVCPQITFSITKMVQSPTKGGQFVKNLTINDARFAPGQNVNFQITVQNTGSQDISKIDVVDTLPDFLTFVSGPGNFDQKTKQLTFSVQNLGAGQSMNFTFTAKVADANSLPNDKSVVCVTNQVTGASNGITANDSSQLCIEKQVSQAPQVFPPKQMQQTPPTGPEMLPLLGLIPGGLAGFFLKRSTKSGSTIK